MGKGRDKRKKAHKKQRAENGLILAERRRSAHEQWLREGEEIRLGLRLPHPPCGVAAWFGGREHWYATVGKRLDGIYAGTIESETPAEERHAEEGARARQRKEEILPQYPEEEGHHSVGIRGGLSLSLSFSEPVVTPSLTSATESQIRREFAEGTVGATMGITDEQ